MTAKRKATARKAASTARKAATRTPIKVAWRKLAPYTGHLGTGFSARRAARLPDGRELTLTIERHAGFGGYYIVEGESKKGHGSTWLVYRITAIETRKEAELAHRKLQHRMEADALADYQRERRPRDDATAAPGKIRYRKVPNFGRHYAAEVGGYKLTFWLPPGREPDEPRWSATITSTPAEPLRPRRHAIFANLHRDEAVAAIEAQLAHWLSRPQ